MFAHPPPSLRFMSAETQRTRKLSFRERYLVHEGSTGYRTLTIATYCATLFLGGISINILGTAGTALTSNVHAKITAVGTIFTAEGVGNMLGNTLAGWVLERHAAHSVVCALCLLMFVVVGLVPVCESISHVIALYFLIGSCMGMLSSTVNTMVTWVQHGRNVGPWVNLLNSCFGLGASAAPLLYMAMEKQVGNGLVSFSAIGVFASLPACAAWLLQSPSQPVKEVATDDEAGPPDSSRRLAHCCLCPAASGQLQRLAAASHLHFLSCCCHPHAPSVAPAGDLAQRARPLGASAQHDRRRGHGQPRAVRALHCALPDDGGDDAGAAQSLALRARLPRPARARLPHRGRPGR